MSKRCEFTVVSVVCRSLGIKRRTFFGYTYNLTSIYRMGSQVGWFEHVWTIHKAPNQIYQTCTHTATWWTLVDNVDMRSRRSRAPWRDDTWDLKSQGFSAPTLQLQGFNECKAPSVVQQLLPALRVFSFGCCNRLPRAGCILALETFDADN